MMTDTVDLTSYQPGYDAYCDELENEAKVPYSDYEKLEEKVNRYEKLTGYIKSALEETTTDIKKIQMIKSLIEEFEE